MRAYLLGILFVSLVALPVYAQQIAARTVEEAYPGLSSGALRQARLVELPKGTLLRANTVVITEQQLTDSLAKYNPGFKGERLKLFREQLQQTPFYLLEVMATNRLLLAEARAWVKEYRRDLTNVADQRVVTAYYQSLAAGIIVTDTEARAFYEENKEGYGRLPYDMLADQVKAYIRDEIKVPATIDAHIATLGERFNIDIAADWVDAQSVKAFDNPLDRARRSGKIALAEFGLKDCSDCVAMAPDLAAIAQAANGSYEVITIDVYAQPLLSMRYNIGRKPGLIFFDNTGKEVFRHGGPFPKQAIVDMLTSLQPTE